MNNNKNQNYQSFGEINLISANPLPKVAINSIFFLRYIILCVVLGISLASCNSSHHSVTICREQAPENPYVDDAKDSEMIYSECKKAAISLPDDAEIAYLAATSALETDRTEEALIGFQNAERLGSCKALYFLADFARYKNNDKKTAEEFYRLGSECGDKRATEEIYSAEVFANSAYPELVEALVTSDIEKLNKLRFSNASYITGWYSELGQQYLGGDFQPCWKADLYRGGEILNQLHAAENGDAVTFVDSYIYEQILPIAYQVIFPQGSRSLEQRRESLREAGKADLLRLVQSSNCNSLVALKFVDGIEAFAKQKKTLYQTMKELYPQINSIDDLREIIRSGGQGDK